MQSARQTTSSPKVNVLILAFIAFILRGLPASLMGVAWPTLRVEFAQPLDALGLLLIAFTVGYVFSSFFIARLLSRLGLRTLLVFACALAGLTYLGYAVVPSWAWIVGLGLLTGVGLGMLDSGLNTYAAAEYGNREMQWLHAFYGLGATFSPLIMTLSLSIFATWRPAYVFVGTLMLLMGTGMLFTLPAWKHPDQTPAADGTTGSGSGPMDYPTSVWQTLFRWAALVSILLCILYCGAEFTLGNWTYTLFTESRGMSPQLAGLWASGFWATFTLGRMLGGLFARRLRMNTLLIGGMSLALVGALLVWWNPLPAVSVAGLILMGFAMAPLFPGLVSTTSQRVGPRHATNTIGLQLGAANVGGALVPALAGVLAREVSLETIPVILVVCLISVLLLYTMPMWLKRSDAIPAEEAGQVKH